MSRPWDVVEIANSHGIRARVASYGARLLELWTPDRAGKLDDVVLGFPTLEAYHSTRSAYIGCIVGRVANRIRDAQFSLDGTTYLLTANEPPNHLHGGGDRAFDNLVWSVDPQTALDSVTFRVVSQDLDEGYPGVVRAAVTYALLRDREVEQRAEHGAGGPGDLARYLLSSDGGQSLPDFLDERIAPSLGEAVRPDPRDVAGFDAFYQRHSRGLAIERAAIDALR